jgi:DNA repair protein RadC
LSNVVRLPEPIPCRGNVGMWSLPPSIAQSVLEQVHSLQTVKSVEANDAAVRIETPDDAYPLFRAAVPLVGAREGFFILPIDAQRRPICKPVLVSLGHLPGTAAIELGEIFRTAFKVNADAIIVAHNHPSGDPTPSKADLQLTTTLQSAARLLGLKFLDHLILGSPDCAEGRGYVSVVEWVECNPQPGTSKSFNE